MGNRDDHSRFDQILRDNGIIGLGEYDCDQVHEKMDYGEGSHSRNTPHHTEEDIREWVNSGHGSFWDSLFGNAWGHQYGDFIRVALGHIILDEYWTKYTMESDPQRDRDEISIWHIEPSLIEDMILRDSDEKENRRHSILSAQ